MRKVFFLLMMCVAVVTATAQRVIEVPKTFDNIYIGVQGGVSAPLSFNSTFPLNGSAGLKVGKYLSPVVGFNVEGDAWFGSATDGQSRFSYRNAVRATNVSANLTVDLFNWFSGFDARRTFTIIPEVGLGWLHLFNSNANDEDRLSAKTGVQFAWNFGRGKAWQFYAEPVVWWSGADKIQFNKNYAQVGLQAGFIYRFKNSNGRHTFRDYDLKELNDEINELRDQVVAEVHDTLTVNDTITVYNDKSYYVMFAHNSYELSDTAIKTLNSVPTDVIVTVVATASPEGSRVYNKKLSQRRADVVSNYLVNRGVKVQTSKGLGVTDKYSNRICVITIQ